MGDREVFAPSDYSYIVFSPQSGHPSSFLVHHPPFANLRMIFLLGGAVTPRVMEFLIIFLKLLIKHETLLVNQILGKTKGVLQIKLKLNLQEQVKNS
jgi:hypothetical protein